MSASQAPSLDAIAFQLAAAIDLHEGVIDAAIEREARKPLLVPVKTLLEFSFDADKFPPGLYTIQAVALDGAIHRWLDVQIDETHRAAGFISLTSDHPGYEKNPVLRIPVDAHVQI